MTLVSVTIGVVSGQNDILKAFDGEEMVPVCAEGILQVWLPQLCKALGQGCVYDLIAW